MKRICIIAAIIAVCTPVFASGRYGGYPGISGKKTGYFHVQKIDGRWWCIDPDGFAFYVVGTDHVNYDVHWCEVLGYAPYAKNIRERYNNDESAWAKSATDRLRSWGFNLLGANNSPSTRGRGLAYTEFLSMGTTYSSTAAIVTKVSWTGFPDVFNPGFAQECGKIAKEKCTPLRNDPWLFGWFLDNELEWFGKNFTPTGLADETIARPADSFAKQALIDLLEKRYDDIESFNKTWGTAFPSWDTALQSTAWQECDSKEVTADKMQYVRLCADRYFSITTGAIRNADPNHLILGCRFAGNAPDVVDIAGKYLDIFTINYYGNVDLKTLTSDKLTDVMTAYYNKCKRPMMITEWSFPSIDSGLPCTNGAGMRVATQADKAKAYEVYQTELFKMPFFVGSDYFMWVDEPAQGISKSFPENSNYGLVDVNDNPWPVFTRNAARVNKKVYRIHSGNYSDPRIRKITVDNGKLSIAIQNAGPSSCSSVLKVSVDGTEHFKAFSLYRNQSTTLHIPCNIAPGAHYVDAIIDPEGQLDEVYRGDDHVAEIVFNAKMKHPCKNGVAICLAGRSVEANIVSIPISELIGKGKHTPKSIRLLTADGNVCPSEIYDLDNSGNISASDELAFSADANRSTCSTYFAEFDPKENAAKLIGSSKVDSFNIDTGVIRLTKTQKTGAVIDSIKLGDRQMGTFNVLLSQNDGHKPYWQTTEKVDKILQWNGSLMKQLQVTCSYQRKPDTQTAPFSYKAIYMLSVKQGDNAFTSKFVSAQNTDNREWTLSSYYYYPQSAINGDSSDDECISGAFTTGIWFDKAAGGCYGAIAPQWCGISVIYFKDTSGNEHPDIWKSVNKSLKPGGIYSEQSTPVTLFFTQDTDPIKAFADKKKHLDDAPKWRVFGL